MRRRWKQVRSVDVEGLGMGKWSLESTKVQAGIVIESRQEGRGNFKRGPQSEHVFHSLLGRICCFSLDSTTLIAGTADIDISQSLHSSASRQVGPEGMHLGAST